MNRPLPLDRQLADERARHPSSREAARAGAGIGLLIWIAMVVLQVIDRFMPALTPPLPQPPMSGPRMLQSFVAGLLAAVLTTLLLFDIGAAIIRWRRRLAARVWYRDRAV